MAMVENTAPIYLHRRCVEEDLDIEFFVSEAKGVRVNRFDYLQEFTIDVLAGYVVDMHLK